MRVLPLRPWAPLLAAVATTTAPCPAVAQTALDQVPSALVAYGHYAGLLIGTAALVTERLLIQPNMSKQTFDLVTKADIAWGVAGALITLSGYLRVTQYAKGWEFYAHEPIFWLKMTLFAVLGATSFFPTVTIVKRAIDIKDVESPGVIMSDKLVKRMTQVVNAELLALFSIPLTASLMARGVGYVDWFPWQAGAGVASVALFGLGYKYMKEALDWVEE